MPSMGNRLCASRPSNRLIDLFVAGMLVFMGLQAAANGAPVLKPNRLERSQLPPQDIASATAAKTKGCTAIVDLCLKSADHGFVHHHLPVQRAVEAQVNIPIGFDNQHAKIPGFHLLGAASPRGPPETVS
ncbi:hypothetical protein [Agrobacterium sp. CG674]